MGTNERCVFVQTPLGRRVVLMDVEEVEKMEKQGLLRRIRSALWEEVPVAIQEVQERKQASRDRNPQHGSKRK